MSKDTKIVHFTIVDGTEDEVTALGNLLKNMKDKLPFDIEFLITNERVQMHDVKYLIAHLYKLYKMDKKVKAVRKSKSGVKK